MKEETLKKAIALEYAIEEDDKKINQLSYYESSSHMATFTLNFHDYTVHVDKKRIKPIITAILKETIERRNKNAKELESL